MRLQLIKSYLAAMALLLLGLGNVQAQGCVSYPSTICAGTEVHFDGHCGDNYQYTWNIQGYTYYGASVPYTFPAPGTFTVQVWYHCFGTGAFIGGNECDGYPSGNRQFTVTVHPRSVIPVISTSSTHVCSGSSITLTVSNFTDTGSITWRSEPAGYTGTGQSLTIHGINAPVQFFARSGGVEENPNLINLCSSESSVLVNVVTTDYTPSLDPDEGYRKRIFNGVFGAADHYLQTSATGQDLSRPLTQRHTVLTSGNYYSRRFNASANCWTQASTPVYANVSLLPPLASVVAVQRSGYTEVYFSNLFNDHVELFADYYFVSGLQGTETDAERKLLSDKKIFFEPGTYYLRGRDRETGTWGPVARITITLLNDNHLNWVQSTSYDGSPNQAVVGESRSYFNEAGKPLQSQTKNMTRQRVLTSQTLNDRYDRPILSSLPAPTGSSQFGYSEGFMMATDNRPYNHTHFDSPVSNTIANPVPIQKTHPGMLGWYYSEANTLEDHVPVTDFPYTRSQFYEDGSGETKLATGPGENHRLGSGHEVISGSFPVFNELDYYQSLRPVAMPGIYENNSAYVAGTPFTPIPIKGIQKVVRDENGKWAVSITDKEGRTVLSGRPGAWDELSGIRIDNNISASANPSDINHNPLIYFYLFEEKQVTLTNEGGSQPLDYAIEELIQGVPVTRSLGATSWPVGFYRLHLKSGRIKINYTTYLADVSMQFYDDAGRLRTSVSPNGVNQYRFGNKPFNQVDKTEYKYNFQGWLLEMTEPDAGTTRYKYRRDGNIRFSQNAQQALNNHFSYTSYDDIGRPIESGEYVGATSFAQTGSLLEYATQPNWPASDKRDWLKTAYDVPDQDFNTATSLGSSYVQRFVRGGVSFTENENIKTWYSYDELGRVVWMAQKPKELSRVFLVEYRYDFLGNVLQVTQKSFEAGVMMDQFHHYYEYDADKRLSKALTSADGTKKTLQAHYLYYLHGPLKRIELATNLQGIDFVYNIHGWLESINHPDPAKDPGQDGFSGEHAGFRKDAFGMLLDYYDSDFTTLLAGANIRNILPDPDRYHKLPSVDAPESLLASNMSRPGFGITPAFDLAKYDLKSFSAEMPIYSEMITQWKQRQSPEKIQLTEPTPGDLAQLNAQDVPVTSMPIASAEGTYLYPHKADEDDLVLPLYDVIWSELVGVSLSNNVLTKTATSIWGNGGAASLNVLPAGQDGFIEYPVFDGAPKFVGLTDINTDAHFNTIKYSWYTRSNTAYVYVNGISIKNLSFQFGDVLRVERTGSSIIWRKNGTVEHTLTNALTTALIADCAIKDHLTTIAYVKVSFWIPSAQLPDTQYDVMWTDLVGVSVNGNTITKTASSGWGNGGAASVNQLPANVDGWVEFTVDAASGQRMFGFSDQNTDANHSSIDYAWSTGIPQVFVRINGVLVRNLPGAVGDVLRIERVGSTIYFKRNGVIAHTITNGLTSELMADAAINETGVKISNAKASFWIPASQGLIPDLLEYQALKALYDSCNGPNWRNLTNWPATSSWPATPPTAAQMDTWFGIGVANGDITAISMDFNAVNGRLPEAISQLKELRSLNLQRNGLTRLPVSLGTLTKLTTINLYNNLLTGDIPNLSNLTDLATFNIDSNPNLNPGPIPNYLTTMTKLVYLSMIGTKRNGSIPAMTGMVSLRNLRLDLNQLSGPIPNGLPSKLIELDLSGNQLTGSIPATLFNLVNLQNLQLDNNQFSGTIPTEISNLTNLTILLFNRNQFTGNIPSSFNQMTNLNYLYLGANKLTGTIPYLGDMVNLLAFDVSQNPTLDPAPIPEWISNLKKLIDIHLGGSNRTGEIPTSLANLTGLNTFFANDNQLTGSIPSFFSSLTSLKQLMLHNNQLTGTIPASLGALPLTHLYVQGNKLSGAVPSSLLTLPAISYLYLFGNDFTSVPDFSTATRRNSLYIRIDNNRLDYTTLLPTATYTGFVYKVFSPQKEIDDIRLINVPQGSALTINARPLAANTTVIWEKQATPTTWTNITATNQSGNPGIYSFANATAAQGGVYRYRMTNTATPLALQSAPITVNITDQTNPTNHTVDRLYNGNITAISWRTDPAYASTASLPWDGLFMYRYDSKYQLRETQFADPDFATDSYVLKANQYRETGMQYDPNGNLLSLKRYDADQSRMHNFTYAYHPITPATPTVQSNRLKSVSGYATNYTYNAIGQMTHQEMADTDNNQFVVYDVSGKVKEVYGILPSAPGFPPPDPGEPIDPALGVPEGYVLKVRYKYDDRGFRLAKVSYGAGGQGGEVTTWYIRDASGNVLSTYEDTKSSTQATWVSAGNVTISGSTITKSSATSAYDGGAHVSIPLEAAQNGWVQTTVGSAAANDYNASRLMGLASPNTDPGYTTIDYGLHLESGRLIGVYESGQFKGRFGTYTAGDRLRVERINGTVYYKKNDQVFYTSLRPSAGPLLGDVSFASHAGRLLELEFVRQPMLVRTEVPIYGSGRVGIYRPKSDGGHEYVYELTDHLGNVRATLKREETIYLATMEDNGVFDFTNPRLRELMVFENLFETEKRDYRMNQTAPNADEPNPEYSAYLHWIDDGNPATREDIIGPAIALKVEAGDTLRLEVYAKFEKKVSFARNATVAMMSNILGASFLNPSLGIESFAQAASVFNGNLPAVIANSGDAGDTRPHAYLNYILFDRSYAMINAGAVRVPEGAGFDPGLEITVAPQLTQFQNAITTHQAGYVYVWVSNESENTKVWFDDLKVTHRSSRVTQATDYYAWGNVMRENKSPEDVRYRYGYQGQFAEKDEETGWNHFELREYDAVIGRWLVPDPARQHYSLYMGMGNNPVSGVDPDGAWVKDAGLWNNLFKTDSRIFAEITAASLKSDWTNYSAVKIGGEWGVLAEDKMLIQTNDWEAFQFKTFTPIDKDGFIGETTSLNSFVYSGPSLGTVNPDYTIESFIVGGHLFKGAAQGVSWLSKAGPTFSQYKAAYWATRAKPIYQPIRLSNGNVFKVTTELHHRFIPQRWGWAPNWLKNNSFNLQPLNTIQHGIRDSYRFRFFPTEIKNAINSGNTFGF